MNLTIKGIRSRSSIRSYASTALSVDETKAIKKAIADCLPGPFGGRPRFSLISSSAVGLGSEGVGSEAVKVGTYGFIKGAPAFILGAVAKGAFANEDFGYCMEGIVLKATELGLGTCWLGGALRRGQVADLIELGPDEIIPCISPIGKAAAKPTLVDRLVRSSSKGDNRKPASELFFDGNFQTPLVPDGAWGEVLEAVRLGPSASNKQPWRILRSGESGAPIFHLYLNEDKAYNSAMGELKMQNVDMGIAMRHFEVAARELSLPGSWRRLEKDPSAHIQALPTSYHYISSWIAE